MPIIREGDEVVETQ